MIKISVTNKEFYSKNYLIFTKKISFFKKDSISLDYLMVYSLSKLMLFVDKSTFQVTVSPFSNSNISRMTFGIDVDSVPPVDWTFVLYFNCIPPFILLMVFILLYW